MSGEGILDAAAQKAISSVSGEWKPVNYNRDGMMASVASNTIRNTVGSDIQEHLGTVAAKAYQLGMGLQDSAAIAGLTIINPALGKMGTMLLGGASATQTMLDAVERGASDEQAIGLGLLSGAFEIFFEKYELDELLDNVKYAVKGAGKGALVKTMARQALSEGVGEGATEIANILADCAVMAEKSNWQMNIEKYITEKNMTPKEAKKQAFIDAALQVGEAVAGGLISGLVSSGAYTGVQTLTKNAGYTKTGATIMDADGGVEALMNLANQVAGVSSEDVRNTLTSQIDKVSQKPTARNVGQLNATVQAANNQANATVNQASAVGKPVNTVTNPTNTSINPSDVAESLKGKGILSQKIDTLAAAIVARVNGQQLTNTQRSVLSFELGRPSVQRVINELIQKKSNGVDSAQSAVYDDSKIRDGLTDEEKTALWDLAHQHVGVFSNHAYAPATEDSAIDQSKGASSKGVFDGGLDASIKNIDYFIEGTKSFDDVLDDYAKVYADKINSNQLWSWEDTIPGGENLTPRQRSIIKQQAVEAGLIPDIRVTKVEGMRYGFADFESAEVVMKTQYLPENMWKMSDAEQFKWLNEQNGGSVEGYTWHHTETPGEMQLVPTGIHNITTHNGGRTAGMWADFPR